MAESLVLTARFPPDLAGARARLEPPAERRTSVLAPLGAAALAAVAALSTAWAVILGPGPEQGQAGGPVSAPIAASSGVGSL